MEFGKLPIQLNLLVLSILEVFKIDIGVFGSEEVTNICGKSQNSHQQAKYWVEHLDESYGGALFEYLV